MAHLSSVLSMLALPLAAAPTVAPECKRFDQIYSSGSDIATKMWGSAFTYETNEANAYTMWFFDSAFTYETNEANAYTMWFFDSSNPNDDLSRNLGHLAGAHDDCNLSYYHKDIPGPEPDSFTECHPWKDNACCAHATVMSARTLNEAYGAEYHWDRCGPLSQECERFFVQEACFYECDPNAGFYRKWQPGVYDARCDKYAAGYDEAFATATQCEHNAWQMHQMPVKASYWDAMYDACRKDLFCGDGDYFSCAATYKALDELQVQQVVQVQTVSDDGLGAGFIALIVCLAIALMIMGIFTYILVNKELSG
eukprot:CAMPEP_0180672236 /NCGR_PEP_ID=MMETSP1037_2-20121125/65017_1 /TAXON_ID=632150 /ORGANISM="Azadinium spinosum, Strain 3D9" /LENGTH=309 /DNA_ID=CAMNT_0022701351 /DNA_START=115 /DNA_END=1040 /DNA_ORIENTATION=+